MLLHVYIPCGQLMNLSFFRLCSLLFSLSIFSLRGLDVSPEIAREIGKKIWKNECNESVLGLTHWNHGETFPSLGIGHFIWYPKNTKECFEESFPLLLAFLEKQGVIIPTWLQEADHCPWNTREEFYRDLHSPKMRHLRGLLFNNLELQAQFMVERLRTVLQEISSSLSEKDQLVISPLISQLTSTPKGIYALVDYVNFKGSGLSSKESYGEYRWGLLQVLQKMASRNVLEDFVTAGKAILKNRVEHVPPERKEEAHWLSGWFNRLDTYLE